MGGEQSKNTHKEKYYPILIPFMDSKKEFENSPDYFEILNKCKLGIYGTKLSIVEKKNLNWEYLVRNNSADKKILLSIALNIDKNRIIVIEEGYKYRVI